MAIARSESTDEDQSRATDYLVVLKCWNLHDKCTSFYRLIRINACCQRYMAKKQCRLQQKNVCRQANRLDRHLNGVKSCYLDSSDLMNAKCFQIQTVQRIDFNTELTCLQYHRPVQIRSAIVRLTQFLDVTGILRVGGRL